MSLRRNIRGGFRRGRTSLVADAVFVFPTDSLIAQLELRDAALSGPNVISLTDRSAQGNDLTGTEGTGAEITLVADDDYGGQLVGVYSTVSSKHLFRSTLVGGAIAQPNTMLWLGEWEVNNAQHVGVDSAQMAARHMLRMEASGAVTCFAGTTAVTIGTPTTNTPTPILVTIDGAASTYRFGNDWSSATVFSATPGSNTMNGIRLGANSSGGNTQPMRGRIAMYALWDKALTDEEVAQVAGYLNQDFGQSITV